MLKEKLSLNSVISQKLDIDVTELNGEKVMMNLERGKYFMLNSIGSVIWDKISEPKKVEEVVLGLTSEYDVSREECEDTVIKYLERLGYEDLIIIA